MGVCWKIRRIFTKSVISYILQHKVAQKNQSRLKFLKKSFYPLFAVTPLHSDRREISCGAKHLRKLLVVFLDSFRESLKTRGLTKMFCGTRDCVWKICAFYWKYTLSSGVSFCEQCLRTAPTCIYGLSPHYIKIFIKIALWQVYQSA